MTKFLKLTILILFIILSVGKLNAEIIEEKVGNVTNFINTEDRIYKMEQLLDNLSLDEQIKLLDKALANPSSYEPIYYVALADSYYKTDKDKAAVTYMIGLLRSSEDIAMCEDTSARAQIGIYPLFAPNTTAYIQSLDKRSLSNISKQALDWDLNNPQRVNPIWACYHGMGAFMGEVKIKDIDTYDENKQMIRDAFTKAF